MIGNATVNDRNGKLFQPLICQEPPAQNTLLWSKGKCCTNLIYFINFVSSKMFVRNWNDFIIWCGTMLLDTLNDEMVYVPMNMNTNAFSILVPCRVERSTYQRLIGQDVQKIAYKTNSLMTQIDNADIHSRWHWLEVKCVVIFAQWECVGIDE